jgi:hypothetical protein
MNSPTYILAERLWEAEEFLGVEHYLQTKEQFIKQHLQHSENDLAVKLLDIDRILIDKNMESWREIVEEHFTKCKTEYNLSEPVAATLDFWLSKYIKLIPSALRDEIIDEEEVCMLLEASGDYFSGAEPEQHLVNAWLPYNSVLERIN